MCAAAAAAASARGSPGQGECAAAAAATEQVKAAAGRRRCRQRVPGPGPSAWLGGEAVWGWWQSAWAEGRGRRAEGARALGLTRQLRASSLASGLWDFSSRRRAAFDSRRAAEPGAGARLGPSGPLQRLLGTNFISQRAGGEVEQADGTVLLPLFYFLILCRCTTQPSWAPAVRLTMGVDGFRATTQPVIPRALARRCSPTCHLHRAPRSALSSCPRHPLTGRELLFPGDPLRHLPSVSGITEPD